MINKDVFREYDIRGIVDSDFSGDFSINLGKAFGTYVKKQNKRRIAVSGDVRKSTNKLKEGLISGLTSTGIQVVDIGIVPTPANYFANFKLDIDGSVQITGSHNPSDYNGFKFTFLRSPFFGKDIQKLFKIMNSKDYLKGEGHCSSYNIIEDYITDTVSKISIAKPIKVIMDCANAAGCIVAPKIFKKLNIELDQLFCEVDGNFPNHHPDPTVDSNLEEIIKKIKLGDYDVGIAYDGDADRVICIDSKGDIVRSDILMSLFAKDILSTSSKHNKIVYDVKCSSSLKEVILELGGHPIEYKTGHSLIKNRMKIEKSVFGGEMSGHIIFADKFYGYDDAIYVSLRLIEILSNSSKSLKDMVKLIPQYCSTPELRFECSTDEIKFQIMSELRAYFENLYKCTTIDGIKIYIDNGWGLLRASNTQPVIVCRVEGKDKLELDKIKNIIFMKLNEYEDIKIEF